MECVVAELHGQRIVQPPGPGRDRTQGDKDRFRDRNRGKLDKNKLKDILTNNPVFGDKGKVRIHHVASPDCRVQTLFMRRRDGFISSALSAFLENSRAYAANSVMN